MKTLIVLDRIHRIGGSIVINITIEYMFACTNASATKKGLQVHETTSQCRMRLITFIE